MKQLRVEERLPVPEKPQLIASIWHWHLDCEASSFLAPALAVVHPTALHLLGSQQALSW